MEVIAVIRDHLQENENVKPNTAFIEELRSNFSEFFNKNGDFNLDEFKNALKENNIKEFSDGYQLNFIGKDYARKQAGNAPTSVIVPDNEHNQKEENKNSKNLFFTGDNLEVLRHLRNNYSNKIDVIYIDPPYNTGNDDFVYPDKFEYSDKQLEEVFGMTKDDVSKLDALKGSKSHSAWLTFMYPRLWLAKQLLTDDGVIFISIDDNEQANLQVLMGDIFGESNFIADQIWKSKSGGANDSSLIAVDHEYILVYAKKYSKLRLNGDSKAKVSTIYNMKDDKGNYALERLDKQNLGYKKSLDFPIYDPEGREYTVIHKDKENKKARWRWGKKTVKERYDELVFKFPYVYTKNYEKKDGVKPRSILYEDRFGRTRTGGKDLDNINLKFFGYPKPLKLINYLLSISTTRDATVLDFFAGSSTTADAVMQLNAEDGGNRKFIMVQLPEKTYELDKNGNKKPTKGGKAAFDAGYMSIDEISRERIKRAAKKIKDENPDLNEDFDGGFKHYRVVSPEKETLDKIYDFDPERYELVSDMVDSFSSSGLGVPGNASGEDTILTTWLAEDGYDFNTDDLVEYDFAGYKAFGIKDTRLYLIDGNLHSEQTKELLNQLGTNKVKFQSIVVYGYSFNVIDMKELERGLSQLNSKVNLIKRY